MKTGRNLAAQQADNNSSEVCKERMFDRELIHSSCIKICEKLHQYGFDAWLVGGCIRDLLLGYPPKDFDIVTVATPQQIKDIFKRQCLIIGRRFQITHIYVKRGEEPIEVSTLRANSQADKEKRIINHQGRIERDNIFGKSLKDDAYRRDFTINSIYYHPISDQCFDFMNGIEDIEKKIIASIGNPEKRFVEDPLRMIRAIRFRAKTGLSIAEKEVSAMHKLSHHLQNIPPARMLDETRKLFLKGHALSSYQNLREYNLLKTLFPNTDKALNNNPNESFTEKYNQFIVTALENTDKRIAQGKPVSMPFLFATLLWTDVQHQQSKLSAKQMDSKLQLYRSVCFQQRNTIRLSKLWIFQITDIWIAHEKLVRHVINKGNDRQAKRLFTREKFRAAYDFLCLRVQSEESQQYKQAAQWWTDYQELKPFP